MDGPHAPDVTPYDALLLVSFGGPEGPDDVLPFLRRVTAGRDVPDERLAEVAGHYHAFGGRSPLNDQCRALLAAVRDDLSANGIDLPVYWGNRNWDPFLRDAVRQMAADGVRRAACFVTSAYSSYSGCRQYREDLFDAVSAVREPGAGRPVPRLDRLRHYFNHPGFLEPFVDGTVSALERLPDGGRGARLVFVTHSIPTAMAEASGRHLGDPLGGAYVRQHEDAARTIALAVGRRTGQRHAHDLVFCSRSGPPRVPWLEPDVNDHLEGLAREGVPAVAVAPLGFVSDHMEVVFDLDTEARATAERVGLGFQRVPTPGVDGRFVAMVRDLLLERAAAERGEPAGPGRPGPARPQLGRLPGRLLRQPARRPARALRSRPPRPGGCAPVTPVVRASGTSGVDPFALRDLAVQAAVEAAAWVAENRPRGRVDVASTKSSPTDVVTEFDTGAERLLRRRLLGTRPDDGILGEEGASVDTRSGVVWVVDPIDGTVNFVYDHPGYAVSVAAQVGGESVAGAVVDIRTATTFSAVRGGGALLHAAAGSPARDLRVPEPPSLDQALVATGFGYAADLRAAQAAAVAGLLGRVRDIRRVGSASLDLCMVATGQVDAYLERGLNEWDRAAGGLVAQEAGARVVDLDGGPASKRMTLAAAPGLLEPLRRVAVECGF